jgi:hypothetical protein
MNRRARWLCCLLFLGCPKSEQTDAGVPTTALPDPVPRDNTVYRADGPPGPYSEPPLEVVREFTCRPENVPTETIFEDVEGTANEHLAIVPQGDLCNYQLVYKIDAQTSTLSTEPSGYVLGAATRFSDGARVVCSSALEHHEFGAQGRFRQIDRVPIRCWASSTTTFGAPLVAVAGSPDYAAWVRKLSPHPTRSGAYVLEWSHDFSFQFFNMSDNGRPATDGVYETVLTFDGTTLAAEPAVKTSDRTNPMAGGTYEPFTPSDEEKAVLLRLSEGP